MAAKIVLLRHGESAWNKENRFTGWTDVDLSENGMREAEKASALLRNAGFAFDQAYSSVLRRAIRTLWIVLDKMDLLWIPVERSWRLNERHYGALQGLNKAETADKYGEDKVHIWRRSYDIQPPALDADDDRNPIFDKRYESLSKSAIPLTECLKDTAARMLPYWHNTIFPSLMNGKKVIVAAHGNSIRALVQYLDNMTNDEIINVNIPTGVPLVYEFDSGFNVSKKYYLGDSSEIESAQNAVANQLKSK